MESLTTLTRTATGWASPAGETFQPDAEGCLLIPTGYFLQPDGSSTAHTGFEIYPGPLTNKLFLYRFSTYIEELTSGSFYLLIENQEHQSEELAPLVTILQEWLR